MLISFSVSNFRSFKDEETLSLVASKTLACPHDSHKVLIPGSDESALRAAVIYGANGAGKSNLFKAISFVKDMAIRARNKNSNTGRDAFKFSEIDGEPSSFDLQFFSNDIVYRYVLKVDDIRVVEEWLATVSHDEEKIIYERITETDGKVSIETPGLETGDKVAILATLGGPHNQTFLATASTILDTSDWSEHIRNVIRWFLVQLRPIAPDESIEPIGHMLSSDSEFLKFSGEFLKNSSTGIDHLSVEKAEISEEDLVKILPKAVLERVLENLKNSESNSTIIQVDEEVELLLERKDSNHFYHISIKAAHNVINGKHAYLSLLEESDGTRRLLQLITALRPVKEKKFGSVYFVDEIDRSMHPMLIWKFLESFMKSYGHQTGQIIVTTHESNLLDLDLMRRDEIWFVEKDAMGASHLFSLLDFKIRKDAELRKHYLQGRFGAVPFLGNIDRLIQGQDE